MAQQRLPIVNQDDGTWGDILRQYLMKEHTNDDTDNAANGGHQKITITAGTATAGTAPLKFTSGTLLTSPEAGAMEFNGDHYYLTQTTSTTRKKIAMYDDTGGATGDIYYKNSSGYFTKLPIGSTGDFLSVSGGIPAWTATIPNTSTVTVKDTNFTVQDDSDATKQAKFQAGSITAGQTRTLTIPDASTTLVGTDATQTLTNKRLTSRVSTTTSSATPTINTDNVDVFGLTAQAVNITSFTTNLSGTPTDGQRLTIYIVGTASRTITWGASFENGAAALPTTTSGTQRLDVILIWNAVTSKWRCMAAFSDTANPVVTLTDTQTLQNKTLDNSNTATFKDTLFTLQDDGDTTKQMKLQLSGISTGTTRTLSVPNADTTLLGMNTATAKGDIYVATASNAVTRLGVGTDNYVLTADSAQSTGVKWAAAAGGGGMLSPVRVMAGGGSENFTISGGTVTQIAGTTIDGVSVAVGDRVLIMAAPASSGTGSYGSNQPGNGIYVVTGNTTNISLSRAADMSGSVNPAGMNVTVTGGSWPAGNTFSVTSPTDPRSAFTYGTTSMQWAWVASPSFATINSTQTFTNKTLTDPKINSIKDANGVGVVDIVTTASAVNRLQFSNNITNNYPIIEPAGSDSNIGLAFHSKGTGTYGFYDSSWSFSFGINAGTPGSNVNYIGVTPATTTVAPSVGSWGSDTDVGLNLTTKGNGTVKANNVDVATISGTQTLTNKRIQKRTGSTTSSATPTINTDNVDLYSITALATNITSMTTNLSGTPVLGDQLLLSIKDDGSARTITWGTSFVSTGVGTLPTTTVAGKVHWVGLTWDGSKWACMASDAVGY